ncbi:MAG TPA: TolC family protein, partial [Gammaproteobacteria bacterium]
AQPRPTDERGLGELALGGNPRLQAQRARVAAAEARLGAAQLVGRPTLSGEVELSEYSRESATRDPLRAGVYVELPLFRGGRDRAEQAARAAEVEQLRAELDGDEQALQQEILETWQALRVLQLQRSAARRELEFRELYLDRSRAQYEMELRADLGDAMVEFSGARLRAAEADFRLALAWERLDALTNGALGEQIKERDGDERKR